nr:tnf receptor-associated factor 5 [Quercus suber]
MSNRSERRSSQPIFSRFMRQAASHFTENGDRVAPPSRPSIPRSLSTNARPDASSGRMPRLESRRAIEEAQFLRPKLSAVTLDPPVDFRLLDYVGTCDSNLVCAICRCTFVDPIALTECDHCFCRECIQQSWSSQYHPAGPRGPCPSCRTPSRLGPRSATTKILVNIIDDLLVKCPQSEVGCTALIKRGEVQDHVNIYCGFALVECSAADCTQGMQRKDLGQGCLHYGVSCLDCRKEVQMSALATHWRTECPDRMVHCDLCSSSIFFREVDEHNRELCPTNQIPCPGKALGCETRNKRSDAEAHAKSCTFAKLAPILQVQQQRLDEQEIAQKMMSRKLEILETGFDAVRGTLHSRRSSEPDPTSTDEFRPSPYRPSFLSAEDLSSPSWSLTDHHLPLAPPRPPILDFDDPSTTLPDSTPSEPSPYTSPLHHLLSMHESLRAELARVSGALADLDARTSMQTLNENLRTRDEIAYLGAQFAGLGRQVHWLTSAQLQRTQQVGQAPPPPPPPPPQQRGESSAASEVAEAAVSAVGSAVRSAARAVSVGQSMRRGNSEEGRTKL